MSDAALVSEPKIFWEGLLRAAYQILGRSLTRGLDERNEGPDSLPAYLACLLELGRPGANFLQEVRLNNSILRHVSLSFLLHDAQVSPEAGLSLLSQGELCLASGTLLQWKEAVLAGCTPQAPHKMRLTACQIYFQLDRLGLAEIFGNYQKVDEHDKTFSFKPK